MTDEMKLRKPAKGDRDIYTSTFNRTLIPPNKIVGRNERNKVGVRDLLLPTVSQCNPLPHTNIH